ncbi:MAG: hypothetical protein QME74_04735 [Candidatus Edwardsbacteria bacterium]|nr:hypothetical protein [Candidatus Edwardsbacteria bacterium]
MGLSLHYRGKLADIKQIKNICDELTDIAGTLNMPWVALDEDWTPADARLIVNKRGARIVGRLGLKGIRLLPHPACEPLYFLFDSEGNLRHPIGMIMIREGRLEPESAWLSVKTHFLLPRHMPGLSGC